MADLLALLNRFENAAGVYERSDDRADRDELHAARRAILEAVEDLGAIARSHALSLSALVEREAELVKALTRLVEVADGVGWAANIGTMDAAIEQARTALHPKPKSAE